MTMTTFEPAIVNEPAKEKKECLFSKTAEIHSVLMDVECLAFGIYSDLFGSTNDLSNKKDKDPQSLAECLDDYRERLIEIGRTLQKARFQIRG